MTAKTLPLMFVFAWVLGLSLALLGIPTETLGIPIETLGIPIETLGIPTETLGIPTETAAVVPSPIVGAGLPGLIAACGALIALARRRRQRLT
jgi:hypothetical protein